MSISQGFAKLKSMIIALFRLIQMAIRLISMPQVLIQVIHVGSHYYHAHFNQCFQAIFLIGKRETDEDEQILSFI